MTFWRVLAHRGRHGNLWGARAHFSPENAREGVPAARTENPPMRPPASLGADEAILARRGRARRRVGPHGSPHAARAWRSNSLIHKALGATAIGLGRRWPSNGGCHGPSRADLSGTGVTAPRSLSFARVHLHASVFFVCRSRFALAHTGEHAPSRAITDARLTQHKVIPPGSLCRYRTSLRPPQPHGSPMLRFACRCMPLLYPIPCYPVTHGGSRASTEGHKDPTLQSTNKASY